MDPFYCNVVNELIENRNASILVCGAHQADRDLFKSLGFKNVLLSGMDERDFDHYPFEQVIENAESLSFSDESFDYVVIHSAIHHTQSPHRVLTEMYRVGKKGILAFEGRDSLLIRLAEKFGFTQKYEVAGTYPGNGVNGTDIPNYIYRWTEREIEKTINTFSPCFKHKFLYRYGTLYPNGSDLSNTKKIILRLVRPFYFMFAKLFPKQQNLFAFYVEKPTPQDSLLPWLIHDNNKNKIEVNYNWIKKYYTNLRFRN